MNTEMTDAEARDLVVVITHGIDHESSSPGLTIALGGLTAGLTQARPLEPLADMLRDFLARGGTWWACTRCVKSRGYVQENLLDGVVITGASVMDEKIKRGAATLSS